jgi:hypothetical protein
MLTNGMSLTNDNKASSARREDVISSITAAKVVLPIVPNTKLPNMGIA